MGEFKMKIVYFGNNMFSACLKYLIDEGHQVLRVYFNEPKISHSAVLKLCEHEQIATYKHKPELSELNHLISLGVDMFIVAEFLHILPQTEVKYAINIHPTKLPKGRGPTPLPYLIKHPESSGVTFHKITNTVDAGDVILQADVPVSSCESITTLMVKLHIESVNLIKTLFSDIDYYYDTATPQVNFSYWPKIEPLERVLDWQLSTKSIKALIRTFGFLGLVVKLDNVLWNARHLEVAQYKHNYLPGVVVSEDEDLLVVSSLDGVVCIHKSSLALVS